MYSVAAYPRLQKQRDAIEAALGIQPPSGLLHVLAVPTDSDELVISDGVTATTYTFKDTASATNDIEIGTGGTAVADTVTNIIAAINVNAPGVGQRGIIAFADLDETNNTDIVHLQNTVAGALGNVAITCDADGTTEIVLRGMWSVGEITEALPNDGTGEIWLGRLAHRVTVYVDENADCQISFQGTASDSYGPPVDGSMLLRELHFASGVEKVTVNTTDDQSSDDIHLIFE